MLRVDLTTLKWVLDGREVFENHQAHLKGEDKHVYYESFDEGTIIEPFIRDVFKLHNISSQRFHDVLINFHKEVLQAVDDETFVLVKNIDTDCWLETTNCLDNDYNCIDKYRSNLGSFALGETIKSGFLSNVSTAVICLSIAVKFRS